VVEAANHVRGAAVASRQGRARSHRVPGVCHVDNIASARLLEHSGLAPEGRLVRYAVLPNISAEPQDCLLFAKALR
jgi:ribosomal-protein-alanine N-acetyltransferase